MGSQQRLTMIASELERLRKDEQHESSQHAKAESALRASEDRHRSEAAAQAAIEASIDTLRSELMQHTGAAERFDEVRRQLENNLERLAMRADGLEKEGIRAAETFTTNQKQADELAENLSAEEAKLAELNVEKEVLLSVTVDSRNELRRAEAELKTLQDEHSAKSHRLSTLLELEKQLEDFSTSNATRTMQSSKPNSVVTAPLCMQLRLTNVLQCRAQGSLRGRIGRLSDGLRQEDASRVERAVRNSLGN